MKRFWKWLAERFLPTYLRERLAEENERLRARLADRETEIARLNAYIDGLENGVRAQRKVIINAGGMEK